MVLPEIQSVSNSSGQKVAEEGSGESLSPRINGEEKVTPAGRPIFSIVKHYPPVWHQKLKAERDMIVSCSTSVSSGESGDMMPLC